MLADQIETLLVQIHIELQFVEAYLRNNQACYVMQGVICIECGKAHPVSVRKCYSYNNNDLLTKYCTGDSRIGDYFAVLRKS
ncbi:hypothetical protein BDV24DRAFT_145307 [Aspergillus arachidicola]|uniref:Uncharacterized protein n=1 Tax=Aspergillus arachidicola TaxID=656916 RepID=A0A5N6XNC1_9EURO|nr:hypothetical protein BDV24DRAFT_145307 [Aspergillus arachidicola]